MWRMTLVAMALLEARGGGVEQGSPPMGGGPPPPAVLEASLDCGL